MVTSYSNVENARILVSENTYYSVGITDATSEGKTTRLYSVRKWVKTKTGQTVPTKDGFAVPVDVARAIVASLTQIVPAKA